MKANHPEDWLITVNHQGSNKMMIATRPVRPHSKTKNYMMDANIWNTKVCVILLLCKSCGTKAKVHTWNENVALYTCTTSVSRYTCISQTFMFLLQGETILEAFGSPEHGVSIIRGKIIYFGKNLSSQNLMQQYHVTRLFTFLTEHIGTASNSAKIRCRNASDWRGKKNGAIKHDFRAKADTTKVTYI